MVEKMNGVQMARLFVVGMAVCIASVLCLSSSTAFALTAGSIDATGLEAQAESSELTTQDSEGWWQDTDAGRMYFRDGKKVSGLQKIDGKRYYFSSSGILRTRDINIGGATYYIRDNGEIFGAKYNGTYYYDTFKPMTSDDSYDFDTYLWARSIVNDITNAGDDSETKLHKAFDWVMNKLYEVHYPVFSAYETNWMARFARYHFANQGGDCHADAAAFAYLAAAIGYPADACIDAWGTGTMSSHSWTMIGNKVYDPLFAQAKDYWGYYGVTSGTYEVNPTARFRVPTYNSSHNSGAAVCQELLDAGSIGLKKKDGKLCYVKNGVMLRNTWKTINGNRYYFKKDGSAATLSTKIDGVYYVFSKKGVLQRSSAGGKRIVTIAKESYQVDKKGKAVAGWSKDKTKYAAKNGRILKSTWKKIDGKRYYFKKAGVKATYSTKISGVYYVFSKKGVLMRGAKGSGTTVVKVDGVKYGVDKNGKAVQGWSKDGTQRFAKTGMLYTGVHYLNKKFYAANDKGTYLPDKTKALNKAIKRFKASDPAGQKVPAYTLRMLLGTPNDEVYSKSCNINGDDGVWVYDHVMITTARPKGVKAIDKVIAKIEAAQKAAGADARETSQETGTGTTVEGEGATSEATTPEGTTPEDSSGDAQPTDGQETSGDDQPATGEGDEPETPATDEPETPSAEEPETPAKTKTGIDLSKPYEYVWSIKSR